MSDINSCASRRLIVLSGQVAAGASTAQQPNFGGSTQTSVALGVDRENTSGQQQPWRGQPQPSSSYARIHGQVPRTPAVWRRIDIVAKEQLHEVIYEKAVGEGIAKVCKKTGHISQKYHTLMSVN